MSGGSRGNTVRSAGNSRAYALPRSLLHSPARLLGADDSSLVFRAAFRRADVLRSWTDIEEGDELVTMRAALQEVVTGEDVFFVTASDWPVLFLRVPLLLDVLPEIMTVIPDFAVVSPDDRIALVHQYFEADILACPVEPAALPDPTCFRRGFLTIAGRIVDNPGLSDDGSLYGARRHSLPGGLRQAPARLLSFDQNRHVLRGTLDQVPLRGPLFDWDSADIVRQWARADGEDEADMFADAVRHSVTAAEVVLVWETILLPGAVLPAALLVELLPQILEVGPDFGVVAATDGIMLWHRRDEPVVAVPAVLDDRPLA